jgi:hypothetical protein
MMVSLKQEHRRGDSAVLPAATALLEPSGARIMLGAQPTNGIRMKPIAPAAETLFGPRGACLAGDRGPLIVCDTGHHRLLLWRHFPMADSAPADLVIGQPEFAREGRNAGGEIGAATLNVPTGIATDGHVLAIADAWNHRVLLWHGLPRFSNQPADMVLGQPDFKSGYPNRGSGEPTAETMNWCYGVAVHDGRLMVADTGNRRVLIWDNIPSRNGAPADFVLGQRHFTTRDEGAGGGGGSIGMRWPHGVAATAGMLFVADAGSSRVMVWSKLPSANGTGCDFVLGQTDVAGSAHNRSAYDPTAATLNMPYGITVLGDRLVIADTANSRLLGFDIPGLAMGAAATRLAGQSTFSEKGENRWSAASRDSLCWPYGVAACGSTMVVADSGNNRVLVWGEA